MIKNNQNIFDFTLENFGTLENLFSDVLVPNSLPVDQEIKANQEINVDTFEKGNQTVKKQMQTKGLVLTNGDIAVPIAVITENYDFENDDNYTFEDGDNYEFNN